MRLLDDVQRRRPGPPARRRRRCLGPVWSLSAVAVLHRSRRARQRVRVAVAAASISAWVTVCGPCRSRSRRPRAGCRCRRPRRRPRTIEPASANGSVTTTPVSVWLPVFCDRDRVVDHLAGRIGRAAPCTALLDDVQRRGLGHRHVGVVGVRPGLVAVGRGNVVKVAVAAAVAVDLGLGDGVRGRVGPGLPDLEQVSSSPAASRPRTIQGGSSANGSVTVTPVSVWLPVFSTVIV